MSSQSQCTMSLINAHHTGKAIKAVVSCPEPALTRREKGLVTIERYLGCAESAVLLLGKPIRLQFSDISRVIYCNATCVRTSECMSMSVATVAKCVPRIQQSFCSTEPRI